MPCKTLPIVVQGIEVYVSEWYPIVRYGISHNWRMVGEIPDAP